MARHRSRSRRARGAASSLLCTSSLGRVALCGSISTYHLEDPVPGPDNLDLAITKARTLQGYRLGDNLDAYDEFVARVAPWVADGSIVRKVSAFDGVDSAVAAFLSMMRGETTDKTIVRV